MGAILRIFLLAFILFFISAEANGESAIIDGIAARVNEEVITIGDVSTVMKPIQNQLVRNYSGEELRAKLHEAYQGALNTLIDRQLILDYCKQQDMKIPDIVIEERIEGITRDMFQGDQLKLASALREEDMTYDEWRNEIRNYIIVSYMRRLAVDDNIKIAPKAVREAYDSEPEKYKTPAKIRLSMIVIGKGSSEADRDQKLRKASDIRKRLADGGDFAAIASSDSEGSKAKEGGDWGWIELSILRPELAEAAAGLKPGEISDVIETKEELYILKVEDRQDETMASFEDVRARIEQELRQKEAEQLYSVWVGRLRQGACIQVFDVDIYK